MHKSLLEATRGIDQSPTKGDQSLKKGDQSPTKSSNSHPDPSKGSNAHPEASEAGPSGGGGFSGEDLAAAMGGMSPHANKKV